jgi:myosin-5
MMDIIASILHLGQIKFIPDKDGEGSELGKDANNSKELATTLRLLGLPEKEFVKTVTERTIIARNEKYQKKLTSTQASDARDSISRIIYGKLFDWVVATINKEIKAADPGAIRAEIGVLDIFGFECLKENSFEQLCINYTNETLQQQFNQFVFKMEQEEYTNEGIEWSFVSFPDNQDCIDLIELKKKSIFSTLDDECMLAGGTDEKFASRMIKELGEYDRFSVSAAQKIVGQFCINHYAGEVVYNTQTFVVCCIVLFILLYSLRYRYVG